MKSSIVFTVMFAVCVSMICIGVGTANLLTPGDEPAWVHSPPDEGSVFYAPDSEHGMLRYYHLGIGKLTVLHGLEAPGGIGSDFTITPYRGIAHFTGPVILMNGEIHTMGRAVIHGGVSTGDLNIGTTYELFVAPNGDLVSRHKETGTERIIGTR